MSLDLSADKLTLPQHFSVFRVCISLARQRHFCILVPCHDAALNLFPVCEGVCHAKAISAPCLIAASLCLVSTGDFVMQCTW